MNTQTKKTSFGKIMLYSLFAGLTSVVINEILFFIGKAMGAFPETVMVPNQNQPFNALPFIFSSIIPSLVAGLVMGLINHIAKAPKKIFNIIAIVLVLLSLYSPFTIPMAPMSMIIVLNIMHLVVAGNLIYFYNRIIK